MESEPTLREMNEAGFVIAWTRRLESEMTRLGATAAGLHDKTDALAARLSPDAVRKLHAIGAIRNRVAHESTGAVPDPAAFEADCRDVWQELQNLQSPEDRKGPIAIVTEAAGIPLTQCSLHRLGLEEIEGFLLGLAMVPGLNVVAYAGGILMALFPAAGSLTALVLDAAACAPVVWGILHQDKWAMTFGGAVLLGVWIWGLWNGRSEKNVTLKRLRLLPVINAVYFLVRSGREFRKVPLLWNAALLALFAGACWWIRSGREWRIAAWVMAGTYVAGVFGALIALGLLHHRKKTRETAQSKEK